jgi:hypothetical protein
VQAPPHEHKGCAALPQQEHGACDRSHSHVGSSKLAAAFCCSFWVTAKMITQHQTPLCNANPKMLREVVHSASHRKLSVYQRKEINIKGREHILPWCLQSKLSSVRSATRHIRHMHITPTLDFRQLMKGPHINKQSGAI